MTDMINGLDKPESTRSIKRVWPAASVDAGSGGPQPYALMIVGMTVPFMLPLTVPMDVPVDGLESESHAFGFVEPLIGFGVFLAIVALLIAAFVLLRRRGLVPALPLPRWPDRAPAPEQAARQMLAERFARGDISSDDFMERASVLNWTPGSDEHPRPRVQSR